jgi:hypothetical protein
VKTKGLTFDDVREVGLKLPNTEAGTAWGALALKVNGRMFACKAINKSAEPNSLGIRVDFAERDALIEEQPDVYYTASHYENYPCVLVRLSRINRDALEDLLRMGHRFVTAQRQKRRTRGGDAPKRRRTRADE